MRSTFLALMLLAVPTAFAQSEGGARQVLEECARTIEPPAAGGEDLEAACPGIEAALEELGLIDLISDSDLDSLTPDELRGLNALVARYQQQPERETIGVDTLAPILDSLRQPPVAEQSLSWYQRFERWLRELFEKKEAQSASDSWLSRWLEEHPLSEVARAILLYGSVALVVLLALLIIINEIRTATRGRRSRSASMAANTAAGVGTMLPVGSDLDLSGERPSALLRMLIATLVRTGRLNGAHSLTHRELTQHARFDESSQRESFQKVAQLAERELFSGENVASGEVAEALQVGRNLDEQLKAAAT